MTHYQSQSRREAYRAAEARRKERDTQRKAAQRFKRATQSGGAK